MATTELDLRAAIEAATIERPEGIFPARFVVELAAGQAAVTLSAEIASALGAYGAVVTPFSPLAHDLLLVTLPGRAFSGDSAPVFEAAHAMVQKFQAAAAEPEVVHGLFPEREPDLPGEPRVESVDNFPPGCWVDEQAGLDSRWAIANMKVPEAWAFSEANGRPSRGAGTIVAQPDTGITKHPELQGVARAAGFDFLQNDTNPTDPLNYNGNPGHGTSTGSVLVSPEAGDFSGTAPLATHMAIRAIESVVRISQVRVAEAIDFAVAHGAHVITLSLGGLPSLSLFHAVKRAVDADVIVLASAGNCVGAVVWPARYENCIAVAGSNARDEPWKGSSRGVDVAISAPGENVFRAKISLEAGASVGQGQGTSYAVALTAGVAACWLSHHGRANVIAEAGRRGETVQGMFRRLLRATARRPESGWDTFTMGQGVVNAAELLAADFDLGREHETAAIAGLAPDPGRSIRRLAVELAGAEAALAPIDWRQYGPEIAYQLLERKLYQSIKTEGVEAARMPSRLSPSLVAQLPESALTTLGEAALAPAAPAVRRAFDATETRPSDQHVEHLRRMFAARKLAKKSKVMESAISLEAVAPDAPMDSADDLLQRVDKIVKKMPKNEIGEPAEVRKALEFVFRHGTSGLEKLQNHVPGQRYLDDEVHAMEAVIVADGRRPTFLLREGKPPANHPLAGQWKDILVAQRDKIAGIAQGVGRIQPEGGGPSQFFGTGNLVDAGKGYVLTNRHVLEQMLAWPTVLSTNVSATQIKILSGAVIDFDGETQSLNANLFKIVAASCSALNGPGFQRLDAAVLTIEPTMDAEMPKAISVQADLDAAKGAANSICTIGFPGPPDRTSGKTGKIDWAWVNEVLFGRRYGLKRLAPGRVHRAVGSFATDKRKWVLGHDGTTLGGCSGSGLYTWLDDGTPAFGLHFAGYDERSNYAHAIAQCAGELRAMGVPIP